MTPRRILVAVAAALVALPLAACGPTPGDEPTRTPTPDASSPAPDAGGDPTASPEPTATDPAQPGSGASPVEIACSTLLSAQEVYDFNPNYVLIGSDFEARAGSGIATARDESGTACRWQNTTSGAPIDVGVSAPADLAARTAAGFGEPVAGIGDAAWFSAGGGVGVLVVAQGDMLVVIESPEFATAPEFAPVSGPVLAAIG